MNQYQPPCGAVIIDNYRYLLWRTWNPDLQRATFIMLNPSTAGKIDDDPTIRRCNGHAQALGYGSLSVVNLFAYRSADSSALWNVADPIGPENDAYILQAAEQSACLIAAWGGNAGARERAQEVKQLLVAQGYPLFCLGLNQDGSPKHPLYIRIGVKLQPFL